MDHSEYKRWRDEQLALFDQRDALIAAFKAQDHSLDARVGAAHAFAAWVERTSGPQAPISSDLLETRLFSRHAKPIAWAMREAQAPMTNRQLADDLGIDMRDVQTVTYLLRKYGHVAATKDGGVLQLRLKM